MGAVWVYPRKRGGTELIAVSAAFSDGLSPQARGNLVRAVESASGLGSIPASAGEPAG